MIHTNYKKINKRDKILLIITISVLVLVMIFVFAGTLFFKNMTKKMFVMELSSNSIIIKGWGNAKINFSDIENIELLQNPLTVLKNSGGGEINGKIFGNETLSNYGLTKCFVANKNNNTIYIKTKLGNYAINLSLNNETKQMYNNLKLRI